MGAAELAAYFRSLGYQVATEVYVRNPFYQVGRRYDVVVRTADNRFVAFEWKSTPGAAAKPPSRQVHANNWINEHGGTMFGKSATEVRFEGRSISRVIRLGPDSDIPKL